MSDASPQCTVTEKHAAGSENRRSGGDALRLPHQQIGDAQRCRAHASPLCQSAEQRPRVLQVPCIESFREPGVRFREKVAGLLALALRLPEAAQAHRRTQFKRPRMLTAGDVEGPEKAAFRFVYGLGLLSAVLEQQLARIRCSSAS